MIRLLSTIWHTVTETPPFLWALVLVIAVLAGGVGGAAVTHTLYGSLNVPTGGTITDNNATASACVGTNGSKQLAYGSNCLHSAGVTAPITNAGTALDPNFACGTCLTSAAGQTASGFDTWGGTPITAPIGGGQIVNGNISIPPACVATNVLNCGSIGSLDLNWSHWTTAAQTDQWSLNVDIAGDLCLAYAATCTTNITNTNTLNTTNVSASGNVAGTSLTNTGAYAQSGTGSALFTNQPSGVCATNAPTAAICIGGYASGSNAAGIAIGKTTGAWGGTTLAASQVLCFVYNNGTADGVCSSAGPSIYADSVGDLVLGSASAKTVTLVNKLSVSSIGIGMNVASLSGLGHMGTNTATALAAGGGTCGNNSCDDGGTVTLSSGAATVTFHTAYSVTPICFLQDQTAAAATKATPSTTSLVIAGTTSDVIAYHCMANGGI